MPTQTSFKRGDYASFRERPLTKSEMKIFKDTFLFYRCHDLDLFRIDAVIKKRGVQRVILKSRGQIILYDVLGARRKSWPATWLENHTIA